MWRTQFAGEQDTRVDQMQKMNELYQKAIDLRCPEGYYFLSSSYAEGYSVDRNVAMSDALIKKGMAEGSIICQSEYALCLDNLINTSGNSDLSFRPPLESHIDLVWKKYQIFSKASELFLERVRAEV